MLKLARIRFADDVAWWDDQTLPWPQPAPETAVVLSKLAEYGVVEFMTETGNVSIIFLDCFLGH